MICANCHDPHQALARESSAYDGKCMSCHGRVLLKAHAGIHGCCLSGEHEELHQLPHAKYEVPGTKISFTDYKIRVVEGKSFQD